jgi:hypothetical protein
MESQDSIFAHVCQISMCIGYVPQLNIHGTNQTMKQIKTMITCITYSCKLLNGVCGNHNLKAQDS